ncbi:EMSY N-terminal [Cynara cardunculus var. scolymus]|uniref:EMSY N-terminal n=1 Tax=Cynara cardunculus var. scolymus TaxID=59895 RepID=A0A103XHL0_CYNCS|nr:EMSY N-terminal [Cynara cardunculus var. scolymus]
MITAGTDDDLPPPHQNKFRSGGPGTGNGRTMAVGNAPFPRIQNDMETQIHLIEQEAYSSVLRAFKAQSDAITWEMESLITDLRKELRVSDEEHRKLLSKVNADDIIRRIREWRKTNGLQPGMLNSPTASASRKKQKTSQSGPSLSVGPPPPALHQPMPPSSSALNRCPGSGMRGKKPQSYGSAGFTGRDQVPKQGFGGAFSANGVDEDNSSDPLIGRKGRHALVYDANTPNEAWEWVNLREISPNDIRWKWEDVGISHRGGRSGSSRGMKNPTARGGTTAGSGRGRVISKGHSSKADPMDIEKARKVLKDHEQALVDAIAKLEGTSDGESDREDRDQLSHLQKQSVEMGKISRKHEVGEGSDGNKVAMETRDGLNQPNGGQDMQ